jgi:uncharacterized protein
VRQLLIVLTCIVLLGSAVSFAGDYEDAWAAYQRADYKTALLLFTRAANEGNALAQTALGFMYYKGQGVSLDYEQAIMWLRKAADQGWHGAQFLLGHMYEDGKGGPQNYAAAYKWYSRVAANGSIDREMRDIAKRGRDRAAEKIREVQTQAQRFHSPDAAACFTDQQQCGE